MISSFSNELEYIKLQELKLDIIVKINVQSIFFF